MPNNFSLLTVIPHRHCLSLPLLKCPLRHQILPSRQPVGQTLIEDRCHSYSLDKTLSATLTRFIPHRHISTDSHTPACTPLPAAIIAGVGEALGFNPGRETVQ